MIKIPEVVNSLKVNEFYNNNYMWHYDINYGEDTHTFINTKFSDNEKCIKRSNQIVDCNENFVNGFKIVQFANGEYGYIRESDHTILPYRYDIALDFNEHGLAMVGRNGVLVWINKNFEYTSHLHGMVKESVYKGSLGISLGKLDGYRELEAFSKGSIPLSLAVRYNYYAEGFEFTTYIGLDGKVKHFYRYGSKSEDDSKNIKTRFYSGSSFDDNGCATVVDEKHGESFLLFAKGFYMGLNELVELAKEKGLIETIVKETDEYFDENGPVYKKVN